MNKNFLESLKVNTNITEETKKQLVAILKREKTIKETCQWNKEHDIFPQDPKTIRSKIEILAGQDKEFYKLYIQYKEKSKKCGDDYIIEIIDMLKNDLSQRQIADKYNISRDGIRAEIDKLKDNKKLGTIIIEHSKRHTKGRYCSSRTQEEQDKVSKILKEYNSPVVEKELEENQNVQSKTFEYISTVLNKVIELEKFRIYTRRNFKRAKYWKINN